MPDDTPSEPELTDLATTTAVAIPAFRPPGNVTVTDTLSESVYVVPEDESPRSAILSEHDATVNLTGDVLQQLDQRIASMASASGGSGVASEVTKAHLKGLLEALIFASDHPQKPNELAKAASSNVKEVRELLEALKVEYQPRGIQLDEVAGGWIFRTSAAYAPFVRDLTKQKPVRLTRAQLETLAILAYRQPVTRPEIDDIRGVDSGPVLKLLLERDLVRILGKKDEPGRPMIYGTTTAFLEFFGLKSLKDLPTLREFTELSEDSRRVAERELGEVLDAKQPEPEGVPPELVNADAGEISPAIAVDTEDHVHDTTPPTALHPDILQQEVQEPEELAPATIAPPVDDSQNN